MSFLDDLGEQVSNTWNDVVSTGAPALVAGVENYAAAQLSQQAKIQTQQATAAAQQVMNKPGASTGVMGSISGVFSKVGQNAVFDKYGVYILIGGAALIVGGIYLAKR